ncbi:hypothetical protein GCM10027436_12110 [Actinophytocola sediminis]
MTAAVCPGVGRVAAAVKGEGVIVMAWFRATLTRLTVAEIVHFTLAVASPETEVDHLLVVLVVFFVAGPPPRD